MTIKRAILATILEAHVQSKPSNSVPPLVGKQNLIDESLKDQIHTIPALF
jgi:hypothetical protein